MQNISETELVSVLQSLDTLGICLWLWDPVPAQYVYISSGLTQLYGYALEQFQVNPALWASRLHPEDRESTLSARARAIWSGQGYIGEYRLQAANGHWLWLQDQVSAVATPEGTKLRGMTTDISDIKGQHQQLKEISETMPGAIYQFQMDPKGHFSMPFISQSAESFLGKSIHILAEDPTNLLLQAIHPADRKPLQVSILKSAQSLAPWQWKFRFWNSQQHQYNWLRGHAIPSAQANGNILWNGTVLDIDPIEKAAEKIQTHERHLTALIEHMGEGVALVNAEGFLLPQNSFAQQILGYAADQPRHWQALHNQTFLPNSQTLFPFQKQPVYQVLQGAQVARAEVKYVNGQGKTHMLLLTATPILNHLGQREVILVMRDMTPQQLAEERVRIAIERQNDVIAHSPHGYLILNPEGYLTAFNPAAQELLGNHPETDLLNQPFWSLFPELSSPQNNFYSECQRAFAERVSVHFREYYPTLDTWFEVNAYPQQEELSLFLHDVTHNRRHEQVLLLEKATLTASTNSALPLQDVVQQTLNGLNAIFPKRQACLLKLGTTEIPLNAVLMGSEQNPETLLELNQWAQAQNWQQRFQTEAYCLWSESTEAPTSIQHSLQLMRSKALILFPIRLKSQKVIALLGVFYPAVKWLTRSLEIDYLERLAIVLTHLIENRQAALHILEQNRRLLDIAWFQSHQVRRPLANILGLLDLLQKELPEHELLLPLLTAAQDLDAIIHEVVERSKGIEADFENLPPSPDQA